MNLKVTRADVWTVEIDDKPGGLARTLRALADYGADLDYVVAHRQPDKPGRGVLFISPLTGKEQLANAEQVGIRPAMTVPTLKIEGTDVPGGGAKLAKAISDAGVNMEAMSAMVMGHRFVCYVGFDSAEDRGKAETALQALTTTSHWRFWHRRSEPHAA